MDLSEISLWTCIITPFGLTVLIIPEKLYKMQLLICNYNRYFRSLETDKCQSVLRKILKIHIININELKEKYKDKIQVICRN